MNQKFNPFLVAAFVAALWLARPEVSQAQVPQIVSISGTILAQSPQKTNSSTVKPPSQTALTTASLLKQLAIDEHQAGNYATNIFPAGARLVYSTSSGFSVIDKHNKTLVSAANILSLQITDNNNLTSFAQARGVTTQGNVAITGLTYNGGTMHFFVTGLGTSSTRTTNPNAKGNYDEANSFILQDGTGVGVNAAGVSIVLIGFTLTASGSEVATMPSFPIPVDPVDESSGDSSSSVSISIGASTAPFVTGGTPTEAPAD